MWGVDKSVSAVVVGGVRSLVCPFSERQDEIVSFVHSWTREPVLQLCSAEREEGDTVFWPHCLWGCPQTLHNTMEGVKSAENFPSRFHAGLKVSSGNLEPAVEKTPCSSFSRTFSYNTFWSIEDAAAAQRGWGASILGDLPKPPGCGPGHWALGGPCLGRGWSSLSCPVNVVLALVLLYFLRDLS